MQLAQVFKVHNTKQLRRAETVAGRCAMIGMYNLAFPRHNPVFPIVELAATCWLSEKSPRLARFSFLSTFEQPETSMFGYTFTLSPEQELINGRVAMLGMMILFFLPT